MIQQTFPRMLLFIISIYITFSFGDSTSVKSTDKLFRFANESHFTQDLAGFFNQKNDFFKKRYFLEGVTMLEAAFVSYNNKIVLLGEFSSTVGLGKQDGNIIFDPRELDIGFGPMVEYRLPEINAQIGLDHHCFHKIDSMEWETTYWNKLMFSASSKNMRAGEYRSGLKGYSPVTWRQRLAWQASYSSFVRKFFGLLNSNSMSYGHPYNHELALSARWAFFTYNGCAAFATGHTQARVDSVGRFLWTQEIGCEWIATLGEYAPSIFLNWYVVDERWPRENRDHLVEIGLRICR
jgi:hypothetical protein